MPIQVGSVRFPVEGHHPLNISGTSWHLVVRGKVAIALGPRPTQAWRQGGIEYTSRSRQQRTLLLRIPRQGMTNGVSIVSVYAPQSGVPGRVKRNFWEQLSTTLRATKSDDIAVVGGDFTTRTIAHRGVTC